MRKHAMFDQAFDRNSHWTTPTRAFHAPLREKVDIDVVVVGGGITGITAAHLLKQRGLRVALLERHRCGYGQSSRTSAHLTAVPDVPLSRLMDRLGPEAARACWDAGLAAITRIRAVVRDERINCDFSWVRGCLHAPAGQDAAAGRAALGHEAAVANALGIAATYADHVAGLGRPGVWFEGQARLDPLRYLGVLLDGIPGDGSYVFEETDVDRIDVEDRTVTARGVVLEPRFIVVATHAPPACLSDGSGDLPVHVATSYVVSGTSASSALEEGLYWEHRDLSYEYLRIDRHDQHDTVIFGGLDHPGTEAAAAADRFARLERCLVQYVPGVRIAQRWSGEIVESADGLPAIGEVADRVFIATGFGGNGLTFGTLAGMMAAESAIGERGPWHDLFDPKRAQRSGTPWASAFAQREAS